MLDTDDFFSPLWGKRREPTAREYFFGGLLLVALGGSSWIWRDGVITGTIMAFAGFGALSRAWKLRRASKESSPSAG